MELMEHKFSDDLSLKGVVIEQLLHHIIQVIRSSLHGYKEVSLNGSNTNHMDVLVHNGGHLLLLYVVILPSRI